MKTLYRAQVENHKTVREAAEALGIDESTIRYRLISGVMKGERVGRRTWIIPNAEVDRWKDIGKLKDGRPRRPPTAPPEPGGGGS